jgi:MoxR-like ATPase
MNIDMQKIIFVSLHTPRGKLVGNQLNWGLPVVLWSAPSAAKTETIAAMASAANVTLKVLSPGRHGEGAFGIVPVPITTNGHVRIHYPAPEWIDTFPQRGIVFLDEISNAPPSVQSPLLELVNSKMIGDATLGRGVRVIAAANPPEMAANGYDMSLPLSNRFGHFDVTPPSASEFAEFITSGGTGASNNAPSTPFDVIEDKVAAEWPVAWAKVAGPVSAFLKTNERLLHNVPKRGETGYGGAWPSHRTWELACRAIAGSRIHYPGDATLEHTMLRGFVGDGAATELVSFLKNQDLPDVERLLDGKLTWRHNKSRLDVTHAVIGSAVALIKSMPPTAATRKPRAEVMADILMGVINDGAPDLAGSAVKYLVDPRSALFDGHLNNKTVIALLRAMKDFTSQIVSLESQI